MVEEITDGQARLEAPDGTFSICAVSDLPENLKEGDLLRQTEAGMIRDENATTQRRAEMVNRTKRLFHRSERS